MFKNFLTYNLALSFHRSCCTIDLPIHKRQSGQTVVSPVTLLKERLLRSSETMINQFARAVHAPDAKEESKFLAVTLFCLRDCKETLDEAGVSEHEIVDQFRVLHGRMEQICERACESEGGQFRLFG